MSFVHSQHTVSFFLIWATKKCMKNVLFQTNHDSLLKMWFLCGLMFCWPDNSNLYRFVCMPAPKSEELRAIGFSGRQQSQALFMDWHRVDAHATPLECIKLLDDAFNAKERLNSIPACKASGFHLNRICYLISKSLNHQIIFTVDSSQFMFK